MMNQYESKQYDSDEVTRIIRRALKLSNEDAIRHDELMETAAQVGLDSSIVEIAIKEERREYQKERIRKAARRRRRAGFQWHLWSYIVVNAALLLTDNLTPGPWWFHWPVLGWGIGLAFHFKAAYYPGRKRYGRCLKPRPVRRGVAMCAK
jgi:Flp pilus assembly protein TadB